MSDMVPVRARRRRADAVENEAKVRAAAKRAFIALGAAITMDDVAEEAGVSKGTVYKSYPSRDALLTEMTILRFEDVASTYRAAAGSDDPWQGLVAAFSDSTLGVGANYEVLDLDAPASPVHSAVLDGLAALETLLDAAKEQGHVRPEITATQVMALFRGVYAVLPSYADRSSEDIAGLVQIILRGIHT